MKKNLLQIVAFGVLAIAIWFGGEWYGSHKKETPATAIKGSPQASATTASHPNPVPPIHPPPPLMAANEWPEFLRARQAALTANPDLAEEYKQILKKMDAQQAKLDAAMIKANPDAKSAVAKLVILRQKNSSPLAANSGATAKPATASTPPVALTPDEWQQVRTARAGALQANPDLVANSKAIGEEMRAFETKLDAAIVKADPSVSPLIAKFEGNHKPPGATPAPSSVK